MKEKSEIVTNFMQGNLWLSKYANTIVNDIVLPLYLFYDDLEVGNALGSHAGKQKFGAMYASIACLPPRIASRLSSIFLTLLVNSKDKKDVNDEDLFGKVIDELNFLREKGISIKVKNETYNIKFQVVLILGDNLGLNGLFGFVESFTANYYCRMCRASCEQASRMTMEDDSLLRNRDNYESDVKLQKSSHTGIKSPCIFHKIANFHVTQNLTVDMMHDVLEGVCVYVMKAIINSFITDEKYFTLEELNTRIQNFNYGFIEICNKPPPVYYNTTTCEFNVNTLAAEMLCLVRYFGLIIGDLIPNSDKHWKLYQYLRQIIDIVTSPRLTQSMLRDLKILVTEHNKLYINLFECLKPKFHNLIHYARILFENGPCINFWSMRYESFHRQIKSNAVSTSCNKNLLVTIATKQTLQMCYTNMNYKIDVIEGSLDDTDNSYDLDYPSDHDFKSSSKQFYNQLELNGTIYRIGTYLVTDMLESEMKFGEIIKILKVNHVIYFHMKSYEQVTFDYHYHAYTINSMNLCKLYKYEELPKIAPCLSMKMNKTHFIATRYTL